MATKSAQQEPEKLDVEEALELLDKTLDRVKSMYEQYFLGIQKQPPTFLHNDLERKIRDLQGVQIRNTGLRYRFATLQQKYGAYNTYWRRTLRQIENGTYARQLSKLGRKAAMSGEDIPEEILAKMPKRMRDQVKRDREAALALAQRRNQLAGEGDFWEDYDDKPKPAGRVDARGAHLVDENEADIDLDSLMASIADEREDATDSSPPPTPDDELDDIATPAAPPVPQGPASLRAASLGGPRVPRPSTPPPMPTRATGSHVIARPPETRATTEPGGFSEATPTRPAQAVPSSSGSFPPVGRPIDRPSASPRDAAAFDPRASQPIPRPADPAQSGRVSQPIPATQSGPVPIAPSQSGRIPAQPADPSQSGRFAPSQGVRPNPIQPGSSMQKQVAVESMQGPFAREPSVAVGPRREKRDTDLDIPAQSPDEAAPIPAIPATPTPRSGPVARPQIPAIPTPPRSGAPVRPSQPIPTQPTPQPRAAVPRAPTPQPRPPTGRPPPGMTDDDVNALYNKYVQAKQMVGEKTDQQTYGKLLNTINAQAPKIMEQYKAKGVDFSVVVKDNQVIIRAKPKP